MTIQRVKVKSIRRLPKPTTVCDVNVADNHNLFVYDEISKSAILAHNCHDENLKALDSVLGEYYYSLGNIAVQHGFTGYLDAEFSKQHRAKFYAADLNDESVQHYCLSGSNYVSTTAGPKPIGEIQVGDVVHSFNHTTSEIELQPVTSVSHHTTDERMFELDFGGGCIRLTENHEVWSVDRRAYIRVRDLREGEEIRIEQFSDLCD